MLKRLRHSKRFQGLTFSQRGPCFLQYKSFENSVGKGETVRNDQFLLFPQCFLPLWRIFRHLHDNNNRRLKTLSVWKNKQNCRMGKGHRIFFNPFSNDKFWTLPKLNSLQTTFLKLMKMGKSSSNG